MKHIRTTTRKRTPEKAASNFMVLLVSILRINESIIDFIFKM